eukprot:313165-Hanusia_phi.AAC.1
MLKSMIGLVQDLQKASQKLCEQEIVDNIRYQQAGSGRLTIKANSEKRTLEVSNAELPSRKLSTKLNHSFTTKYPTGDQPQQGKWRRRNPRTHENDQTKWEPKRTPRCSAEPSVKYTLELTKKWSKNAAEQLEQTQKQQKPETKLQPLNVHKEREDYMRADRIGSLSVSGGGSKTRDGFGALEQRCQDKVQEASRKRQKFVSGKEVWDKEEVKVIGRS